jgi:hypothetical protein
MFQLIALKRLCVGLVAIIGFIHGFGPQNTFAAENIVFDQPAKYSVANNSMIKQSPGDPQNKEVMFNLLMRIESLERQIKSINRTLDRNMMSATTLRQTRELANDAWTLAVEARAIAVRAEDKADQAQKSIKR